MSYSRATLVQGRALVTGIGNPNITDVTGSVSWSTIADGTQVHYVIQDVPPSANYEWGLGTKQGGGTPSLTRTAGNVLGGSAGAGALTNFLNPTQSIYIAFLGEAEVLPQVSADPAIFVAGQLSYRTDTNFPRCYIGPTIGWGTIVVTNNANTFTAGPQVFNGISNPLGANGNEAFGLNALAGTATGGACVAVGYQALNVCTTGYSCVAVGYQALLNNTIGGDNIAIGKVAMRNSVSALGCVAIGTSALQSNTVNFNTGIGYKALTANTSGAFNFALGSFSLSNNLTGTGNTGVGYTSLSSCTASQNTAIGNSAGTGVSTGNYNTLIGSNTISSPNLSTGSQCTLIGANCDTAAAGSNYGTALGYAAICAANECANSPYTNVFSFYELDSTSTLSRRADFTLVSVNSTHGSNKYRIIFNVWDTLAREAIRLEATGSAAAIGVFGAAAVVQQSTTGTTQQTAAGVGTAIKTDSTSTGGIGSTAYTTADVIRAMKQYGWLAM